MRRLPAPILLLPVALIVAGHASGLSGGLAHALEGALFGPDSYMRLLRVEALLAGDGWYDDRIARANWPAGATLHWTRPFDLLLIAAAALPAAFAGWHDGLRLAACLLGPALHLAALAALLWAVRPVLPERLGALAGLLFAAQFFIAFQFAPARPDHHGLLTLAAILAAGLALRLLADTASRRLAIANGLMLALFLWLSPEGGLFAGLLWLALGGIWIANRRNPAGARALAAGYRSAFAAGLALLLALPVERDPASLLALQRDALIAFDRLSLLYPAAALAAAEIFVLMGGRAQFRALSPALKLLFVLNGALALPFILAVLALIGSRLQHFLYSPVSSLWQDGNADTRAMLDSRAPGGGWPELIVHLGAPLAVLPYTLRQAFRADAAGETGPGEDGAGAGGSLEAWRFLALAQVATLLLALWQQRWTGYAQAVAVAPLAAFAGLLLQRLAGERPLLAAARAGLVLAFCFAPLLTGALLLPAGSKPAGAACPRPAIARHLAMLTGEPRTLLAYVYAGPELLYFSPHRVVGTPYHRNEAAILDTNAVFAGTRGREIRQILRRREVTWLLVCPGDPEGAAYGRAADSLHARLAGEATPPRWLEPVALPAALAPWRLYAVRR